MNPEQINNEIKAKWYQAGMLRGVNNTTCHLVLENQLEYFKSNNIESEVKRIIITTIRQLFLLLGNKINGTLDECNEIIKVQNLCKLDMEKKTLEYEFEFAIILAKDIAKQLETYTSLKISHIVQHDDGFYFKVK